MAVKISNNLHNFSVKLKVFKGKMLIREGRWGLGVRAEGGLRTTYRPSQNSRRDVKLSTGTRTVNNIVYPCPAPGEDWKCQEES